MERGESISTTKFIVGSLGFLFLGVLAGAFLHKKDLEAKSEKVYPVRVYYDDGSISHHYFDCDSANLNYAWKDGVKIQLKDVDQIIFK